MKLAYSLALNLHVFIMPHETLWVCCSFTEHVVMV